MRKILPFLVWLGLCSAACAQANTLYDLASSLAGKSVPVDISTATTTQLIAPPAGFGAEGAPLAVFVMGADIFAGGAGNIQFIAGTGVTCGTGAVNVTGPYKAIAAGQILTRGGGFGPIWILPPGAGLCAVTSAAVEMAGSIAYRLK